MTIEVGGEYVTRDGREVRILGQYGERVIGFTIEADRDIRPRRWRLCGHVFGSHDCKHDLIPAPKKHTRRVWACWRDDDPQPRSFATHQECLNYVANFPQHKWIGITGPFEHTFTEGDGLSEGR